MVYYPMRRESEVILVKVMRVSLLALAFMFIALL